MSRARTIWKFAVLSTAPMTIDIPGGGLIVHVGRDPATGLLAFWADVYPDAPLEPRRFALCGTGHEIPHRAKQVGTAILGELVWHLFELPA